MVGFEACGSADLDARRAATVLSAYFEAEQSRAFRRWVCRLASVGVVWLALTASVSTNSTRGILEGIGALAVAVAGSAVAEWRAAEKLNELIRADDLR